MGVKKYDTAYRNKFIVTNARNYATNTINFLEVPFDLIPYQNKPQVIYFINVYCY